MSLLVICEILALFDNTLTTDHKYSLCNSKHLPQAIQMQLSKNQEIFLNFSLHFSHLHQILNILI